MSNLRAGVARSDVTTQNKLTRVPDPLYATNPPPENNPPPVLDRLYAKALVLDDGKTRLAIVTIDCVAIGGICDIGDDFLPKLRARIENELKLPGADGLVNAW